MDYLQKVLGLYLTYINDDIGIVKPDVLYLSGFMI